MRHFVSLCAFAALFLLVPPDSHSGDRRLKSPGKTAVKREVDLSGEWRVFLPAGFEHKVTITRDDSGEYRVTPESLTFSSVYRVEDGYFVSTGLSEKYQGEFYWKQNSPYLLTLTKQTARVGSEYVGAVLFRNRGDIPPKAKRAPSENRSRRLRD